MWYCLGGSLKPEGLGDGPNEFDQKPVCLILSV